MSKPFRFITVAEILDDLGEPGKPLARSTWDEWKAKGKTPPSIKLPSGKLRIRRDDYEQWLDNLRDVA